LEGASEALCSASCSADFADSFGANSRTRVPTPAVAQAAATPMIASDRRCGIATETSQNPVVGRRNFPIQHHNLPNPSTQIDCGRAGTLARKNLQELLQEIDDITA
jgi:hypothetical protein